MSQWQQQFAEQMEALCSQSTSWFERFAADQLEPAFESVSEFVARWHYETSCPPTEPNRRAYRFALTENGYLLIWFRVEGFDELHCEYEYALPGIGRVNGVRSSVSLREADQDWTASCFQMALSNFVTKFVELGRRKTVHEPVTV